MAWSAWSYHLAHLNLYSDFLHCVLDLCSCNGCGFNMFKNGWIPILKWIVDIKKNLSRFFHISCIYCCILLCRIKCHFDKIGFCENVEDWKTKHGLLLWVEIFLLGFYVSNMMVRWWSQITNLPQIKGVAIVLNGLVVCK